MEITNPVGMVFNIQRMSLHDGPGIRSTVFLKGCPLRCLWCQNPESLSPKPELALSRILCNKCHECLKVCPAAAITVGDSDTIAINRSACNACGKCVEACKPEALRIYGREMTAQEVFEVVRRDDRFYRGSHGGVTASGGEPLFQASFVRALFQMRRENKIHTCLETSGYASSEVLESVLEVTDFVLFDIKHIDAGTHRTFTGRSNQPILRNARIVAESGIELLFRMPLIPGVNDSLECITVTAQFIKGLGKRFSIELIPYHRLGLGKYQALDRRYQMENIEVSTPEHIEEVRQAFDKYEVACSVSK